MKWLKFVAMLIAVYALFAALGACLWFATPQNEWRTLILFIGGSFIGGAAGRMTYLVYSVFIKY